MKELYEAWSDDEGIVLSTTDGIRELKAKGQLAFEAKMLHVVEAESWKEAVVIHHEKMGWVCPDEFVE